MKPRNETEETTGFRRSSPSQDRRAKRPGYSMERHSTAQPEANAQCLILRNLKEKTIFIITETGKKDSFSRED